MCRTTQHPENVAQHIAVDICTECKDIIWANEEWFAYKVGDTIKRLHRSCLGDILSARINEDDRT